MELNDLSISELFEDLLSWDSESKLITPKNITGTYFGALILVFQFVFCVMFFLAPERAPKAGPATCSIIICYLFPSLRQYNWRVCSINELETSLLEIYLDD